MKKLLLLAFLLPAPAAAQNRGRPPEADHLTLTSAYSGRDGFVYRELGLRSAFTLGRAGGYAFTGAADAVHHRTLTGGHFPGELYDTSFGLRAAGKKWSFGAGVKSNSDRPFNSPAETDFSLDAVTTLSRRGPHQFMFGFNYSSRRSFLRGVPFPYVSYSYNTERLNLFFPFGLKWRPVEGGELSASYFPPRYFTLAWSQRVSATVKLSPTLGLQMNQYLLAGRRDKDDSLFLEQPYAGLRTEIAPRADWLVSLWTAWGFRGRYFTGRQYDERHDKTSVGPGFVAGLNLKRSF